MKGQVLHCDADLFPVTIPRGKADCATDVPCCAMFSSFHVMSDVLGLLCNPLPWRPTQHGGPLAAANVPIMFDSYLRISNASRPRANLLAIVLIRQSTQMADGVNVPPALNDKTAVAVEHRAVTGAYVEDVIP